ncbi:aspartate carbamoyltransferase [Suttonella ornithocola]|uniref:Aspartate carbamoyltransferase n=1 Tax=Suttonella ornithocola TaxID=279832 RepID=A0A380MU83_9GAMM|nr:aspartate carbamoyltransferase [Suttonella ornithocola]SUO95483.1 Aspartate carbamoyltransferase catalytic chain [Suttonella ornithocola]
MSLTGRHILSIDPFTREDLEQLLTIAQRLEPVARRKYRCDVLNGAMLANLFFEASTRTRMSFHTAFARLGGNIVDTTGFTFSSISKGESLEDTARVIAGYADTIVMRHPDQGSVAQFAAPINTPVINAGDGTGEHPSQALLDYYTISAEFSRLGKTIDGMTIAMCGDLKHGRTIHSLCKLLSLFNNITFKFVAPDNLRIPHSLIEHLKEKGHKVQECNHIADGLPNSDVIYATRIQRERIENGEQLEGYGEQYRINARAIENYANPEVIIMHPLPRDSREGAYDLSTDLDKLPQLAIFRQTDNGVTMRMALFAAVLGVADELESHYHHRLGYRPHCLSDNDAPFYTFS